jgi:hypothetical protein
MAAAAKARTIDPEATGVMLVFLLCSVSLRSQKPSQDHHTP